MTAKSPVKVHSPGDNQWQWQCNVPGEKKLVYPVKIKSVGFTLRRKALKLVEMEDVKNLSIRFKDFSAY